MLHSRCSLFRLNTHVGDFRDLGLAIPVSIYKRERACIAYMESTVVDISIPPPSFKLVSLSLSRISSILKHPNKSFFNVINIFDIFLLHNITLIIIHFHLTRLILFYQVRNMQWLLKCWVTVKQSLLNIGRKWEN